MLDGADAAATFTAGLYGLAQGDQGLLLCVLAGALVGALLAWLWRGTEISRQRGDLASLDEQLRSLEVGRAGLHGELEQLRLTAREQRARADRLQTVADRLGREHAAIKARLASEKTHAAEQIALLEQSREQLRVEFENLANRIFDERGRHLSSQNRESIESLLKPFGEQIHRFQSRINEVQEQAIRGNESIAGELRNLMSVGLRMSDQAENLARALKGDKKTTGNWGEVQLERTLQLAGLEPGVHYEAQAAFRDDEGRLRLPDFVIKLPDGKHLVIDCKVSLVDYDRAIAAETDEERAEALKAHSTALRRHIDELAAKDYSTLPGVNSPELVFMFMPIEAAYIEALKYNRELFNEGYRKNVVMVSHTTLLPMLRTVAGLWIACRSNEEAREISAMAGDLYNKVCVVGSRLEDMGRTLGTVADKYNRTVTALVGKQGLYGKVERLRGTATNVKGELPPTNPQFPTIEHDRLRVLGDDRRGVDASAPSAATAVPAGEGGSEVSGAGASAAARSD